MENRPGRRQCNNAIHTHTHRPKVFTQGGLFMLSIHHTHTWSRLLVPLLCIPRLLCGKDFASSIFSPSSSTRNHYHLLVLVVNWLLSSQEPLISLIFSCHSIVTEVTKAELPGVKMSSRSFPTLVFWNVLIYYPSRGEETEVCSWGPVEGGGRQKFSVRVGLLQDAWRGGWSRFPANCTCFNNILMSSSFT